MSSPSPSSVAGGHLLNVTGCSNARLVHSQPYPSGPLCSSRLPPHCPSPPCSFCSRTLIFGRLPAYTYHCMTPLQIYLRNTKLCQKSSLSDRILIGGSKTT